jgi:bacteriorhodopsin
MNHIYYTGILSLLVQVITGIIDFWAITLTVPPSFILVHELLVMEFIVQVIEFSFYIWMVSNFNAIKNITPLRYYDWMLTTPTMLITFMFYLKFLSNQEQNIKSDSFLTELKNNWKLVLNVILLNWGMLIAGYLGEQNIVSYLTTTLVGFVPFLVMFYIIYNNFAVQSKQGQKIFWYFSGVWAIYGIAALLPYKIKNSMYNILDLFAKNFFGLFLAYVLYNVRYNAQ